MNDKSKEILEGSPRWNDLMFSRHPTPYSGIAGWIERQRVRAILTYISNYTNSSNFKLLEIGCEAGNLLSAIRQAFPQAQLTGFDISEKALQQAKSKLIAPPIHLIHGDITQVPNLSTDFDIIVCSETLEHIPDYQAALLNIASLGNSGSIFIFTVPLESLKNKIKKLLNQLGLFDLFFRGIEKGMSEWHVNDFSKKAFLELLSQHFEILKYNQIMGLHQVAGCKKLNKGEKSGT